VVSSTTVKNPNSIMDHRLLQIDIIQNKKEMLALIRWKRKIDCNGNLALKNPSKILPRYRLCFQLKK
jgi:hypothetical protein